MHYLGVLWNYYPRLGMADELFFLFQFQLYEDYADKFDLSECKLAIVHCAGLYDSALIENLWQNIIDKGNENFEYGYPQSNAFLQYRLKLEC